MRLRDLARLGLFFHRLRQSRLPRSARIVEKRDVASPSGLAYDHYLPPDVVRSRIVAVHGVTRNGKDDQRLAHFGRSLATVGVECFAPTIKGLADFDWLPSDVEDLVAFIAQITADGRPAGLVGFSFGGSYALVAAARPEISTRLRFVLSFGAFHSLVDLYEHFAKIGAAGLPGTERGDADDWVYLRLVAAHRQQARIGLPTEVTAAMDSLLRRYCHSSSLAEKTAFFRTHLERLDFLEQDYATMDREALEHLSPAGRLHGLACPVWLLHDTADAIVPVDHARRIAEELIRSGRSCRLVLTPVLKHVSLSNMFRLVDWVRIAILFLPVLGAAPEGEYREAK